MSEATPVEGPTAIRIAVTSGGPGPSDSKASLPGGRGAFARPSADQAMAASASTVRFNQLVLSPDDRSSSPGVSAMGAASDWSATVALPCTQSDDDLGRRVFDLKHRAERSDALRVDADDEWPRGVIRRSNRARPCCERHAALRSVEVHVERARNVEINARAVFERDGAARAARRVAQRGTAGCSLRPGFGRVGRSAVERQ